MMSFVKKICLYLLLIAAGLTTAWPSSLFAQTTADALGTGATWLLNARYGFGTWAFDAPPDPLQTEFTADDYRKTYVRDTLEAASALRSLNTSTSEYQTTIDWVTLFPFQSSGYLAQKINILAGVGKDSSQVLSALMQFRNSDGGFGGAKGYPVSNNLDTALALQALKAANYSDATVINQALYYLTSNQNSDGGWAFTTYNSTNVYMTAIVSSTLQQFTQTTTLATAINKATAYLLSHQNIDGGFGSSPSTIYETSLAYLALANITTDGTVLGSAVNYLTVNQSSNGSWNNDPYSTALALQALHAAENRPSTPPPAVFTGTISGMVVDGSTNQPLNGVSIQLSASGGQITGTAVTSSSGAFSLANIPAALYQASFTMNGYAASNIPVTVTAGSIINLGTITLSAIPTIGIIQGTITDASTGSPLSGVLITITGATTLTATTASDGSFKITDITPGSVTISANKTGYYSVSGTGTIPAGGTLTFSPSLSTAPPAATTGGIKGIVTDSATGLFIQGATITISPDPTGTGPLATNATGVFTQNNLEPGTYTVSVDAQNYNGLVYTTTIAAGSTADFGNIALAPKPTSTTISGIVKNSKTDQPIAGADVSITGISTIVKTDLSGAYSISGITELDFIIKAATQGYDSQMFHITLNSHEVHTVIFTMSPSQASDLKINSLTTDKLHYEAYAPVPISVVIENTGGNTISGSVSVSIINEQNNLVEYLQASTIDSNGVAQFDIPFQPGNPSTIALPWYTKDFPPGAYTITAKAAAEEAGTNNIISAEGSAMIIIDPTAAISSLTLIPLPRFANVGNLEQMSIQLAASNLSNIATDLLISYEWKSPGGILIRSGTSQLSLQPEETSKSMVVDTFPYTFAESGNYTTSIEILNGPTPVRITGSVVSVAPNIRIEPSQSTTPLSVVPDGDKRIRREIRLNAVEVKP